MFERQFKIAAGISLIFIEEGSLNVAEIEKCLQVVDPRAINRATEEERRECSGGTG